LVDQRTPISRVMRNGARAPLSKCYLERKEKLSQAKSSVPQVSASAWARAASSTTNTATSICNKNNQNMMHDASGQQLGPVQFGASSSAAWGSANVHANQNNLPNTSQLGSLPLDGTIVLLVMDALAGDLRPLHSRGLRAVL